LIVISSGEGDEASLVVLLIAKGNETFVFRAVVPTEVTGRHGQRNAIVENAFLVVKFEVLFISSIGREETGGRHLLRVAHDDCHFRSDNRSHRFARRHLARFIKNDKVKFRRLHVNILRYAQGAHQHDGTE
jgi:hypothetical protein